MVAISVVSLNVRGVKDRQKRRTIFRHLHVKYPNHIAILQETHSSREIENVWQNEWGADIIYSHGSAHQAGVAILLPRKFSGLIQGKYSDSDGRIAGIQFNVDGDEYALLGVYAPAIDVQEQKILFFDEVRKVLTDFVRTNTLLCGDFNIHLGPLDVEIGKFKMTSAASYLLEILEEFSLRDIWRHLNPNKR